jgi:putative superfamily III holin-X
VPGESESVSDLMRELTEQTTRLAQKEVELAKAEMSAKGQRLGIGAGVFGGADPEALAGAGALALFGKRKVAEAAPPLPEQTMETVKQDFETAKRRAHDGRAQEGGA